MAEPMAGVLSPETRDRLTAASATGRMVLAMVAGWIDREAGPALAAMNDDLSGISDEVAAAVAGIGPEPLAAAMLDLIDALGSVEGLGAGAWHRACGLAGGWLTERPPR